MTGPRVILWVLVGIASWRAVLGDDPIIPVCAALLVEYLELRQRSEERWTRLRIRQLWAELFVIQHEGLEDWLDNFDKWNEQMLKGMDK